MMEETQFEINFLFECFFLGGAQHVKIIYLSNYFFFSPKK
jgi:hypothetical protein